DNLLYVPLNIESSDLPDTGLNSDRHFQLHMRNSIDPNDTIAIKVAKLFLEVEENKRIQLDTGIQQIKAFEEQQAFQKLKELEKQKEEHQEQTRLAKEHEKLIEKKILDKREELKRKYGSK
ncbi:unnamed protein product, partial [Adineta ricciae]